MKAHLTRRYMFSASHRLHSEAMSSAENRDTYGKCNNPYGHGHNYVLEVTVSGPVDEHTGMVCNLMNLDSFVEREVLSRYDRENLNMLPEFIESCADHRKPVCRNLSNIAARLSLRASGKNTDRRNHDEFL